MRHIPLSFRIRAELYTQLATMEQAGLPIDKALSLLGAGEKVGHRLNRSMTSHLQHRVSAMRKLMTSGLALSRAGFQSGVFTSLEASLVDAAISAGSPARTYRRLADYYTHRAMLTSRLKSRLAMPAFVLLSSLLIQPLPSLVQGNLSFFSYLVQVASVILALAGLVYLVILLHRWLTIGEQTPLRHSVDRYLLYIPIVGRMNIRQSCCDFFESLALMLDAGIPMLDALPKALSTISNSTIQQVFQSVLPKVKRGDTLAQALVGISYIKKRHVLDFIATGEASGKLPEMIFRYTATEIEAIEHAQQQLAEWVPRLIYALIAAWIAYGILNGPGFTTELPDELK